MSIACSWSTWASAGKEELVLDLGPLWEFWETPEITASGLRGELLTSRSEVGTGDLFFEQASR